MLFRQLKYFKAVVDCNSFTEAAEQCCISQSAISQQIMSLENELGVQLLVREKRRFHLTPAGEYLYGQCKELLDYVERVRQETKNIAEEEERKLRIGYLFGYEGKALQETIFEFSSIYPEVHLSLGKYSHEDLFRGISQEELDMVLSYQRRAFSDEFENFHLSYIPCYAEISLINPLSQKQYAALSELNELPCILVARKEQQELEEIFFRNVLGIGNHYLFVENSDDARFAVIGNQGFRPVSELSIDNDILGAKTVKILKEDLSPITLNYCCFWKKKRSNYYIEEFASMYAKKFANQ